MSDTGRLQFETAEDLIVVSGKLQSPSKRSKVVNFVSDSLGHDRVSERLACRVLGQSRFHATEAVCGSLR